MKALVPTDVELIQAIQSFVDAFVAGDRDAMQGMMARDFFAHIRDLDLCGRAAFFELYTPVSIEIKRVNVKSFGDVGWGHGAFIAKKSLLMHCTIVLERRQNMKWKIAHLHISDNNL